MVVWVSEESCFLMWVFAVSEALDFFVMQVEEFLFSALALEILCDFLVVVCCFFKNFYGEGAAHFHWDAAVCF